MANSEKREVKIVVFGIFESRMQTNDVLQGLTEIGFRETEVSTLVPDTRGIVSLQYDKGTKASEGLAAGVTGGFALGGALGWMIGVGALSIPGVGPVIAAGPILLALAGAGAGGAIGGIGGALVGLGIPEEDAMQYERFLKEGGMLVSVQVENKYWEEKARTALADAGAKGISSCREEKFFGANEIDRDGPNRDSERLSGALEDGEFSFRFN